MPFWDLAPESIITFQDLPFTSVMRTALLLSAFVSSFYGVSATFIRKARLVLIRLRRLEQIANCTIEASVLTMILFCLKSAKMLMIYITGRHFGPVAFISARFHMLFY